jgi:hypothetical protein
MTVPQSAVPQNRMLARRFEFKYIVSADQARRIYNFVCCYLGPDQYTPGGFSDGYPVHSLYLDSPDLRTCKATLEGHKNRFKLRVRFYDEDPAKPVFFEIKRRDGLVILKQRAQVVRSCADDLLAGGPPAMEQLARPDAKNWQAIYEFCRLRDAIHARPTVFTSYLRAGYEPVGDKSVRVTFDRQIRAGEYQGKLSALNVHQWPLLNVPGVVLELKFTDRFPNWMHELTQLFDLQRGSMAKYVECVLLINDL